ncbi:MAG: SDR family NAD(P)-dependent oxidoreductase [Thermoanaerobaculia bacterium]
MQELPAEGEMAAVYCPLGQLASVVAGREEVAVAAFNGPREAVVSGRREEVREVLAELAAEGVRWRSLTVSHAFHSPLMDPILDPLEQAASKVNFRLPQIPLISNLTGERAGEEIADAAYWRRQARQPVRFADGLQALVQRGCGAFLEIGPQPVLLALGRKCLGAGTGIWLPSLRRGREEGWQMLNSLGALFVHGAAVDWRGLDRESRRRRLALPTYPFERRRYWIDPPSPSASLAADRMENPLLGCRLRTALPDVVFETRLSVRTLPLLGDHRIDGQPVLPGAGYLSMALSAAAEARSGGFWVLEDLSFVKALVLPADEERIVQLILTPEDSEDHSVQIFSRLSTASTLATDQVSFTLHARGRLRGQAAAGAADPMPPEEIRQGMDEVPDAAASFYRAASDGGLELGAAFRRMGPVWRRGTEALCRLDPLPLAAAGYLHPGLLDSCFQLLAMLCSQASGGGFELWVPTGCKSCVWHRTPAPPVWCHAALQLGTGEADGLAGELVLLTESGEIVLRIAGLEARRADRRALLADAATPDGDLYELEWRPLERTGEAAAASGNWVIFSDGDGLGSDLASRLRANGASCVTVSQGAECEARDDGAWQIDARRRQDFDRFFAEHPGPDGDAVTGVVYLWGLDGEPDEEMTASALESYLARACGGALHLVQALARAGGSPPRLWLVTRGGQPVVPGPVPPAVAQAPLWGLGAVIGLEHPALRCVRLDLDPAASDEAVSQLLTELCNRESEDQVALRDGVRYVLRLEASRRCKAEDNLQAPPDGEPFTLGISRRGVLDNLVLESASRRPPGPEEVEIRVRFTGLNFKDVLNALGMLAGEPPPFGLECAGEITALGERVKDLAVGDEVVALAPASFGSQVTVPAAWVIPKPAAVTLEDAATIPVAFLTAYHGLHRLAGLENGRKVLIHAAAGGVGSAAVQLAQRVGAEVFATASPGKWAALKARGVHHLMSSRNLDFVDEVMASTEGRGVDVVLNSLAREFIPGSLSVLAEGGCFLEIGKRGIWNPEEIARVRPDVSYHAFDLGEVAGREPDSIHSMLSEISAAIDRETLRPLPRHSFPLQQTVAAFRYMAQARHHGKIVISQSQSSSAEPELVCADGTYLITGGLGALGRCVSRWLVEQGARHLVLLGRSAAGEEAGELQRELELSGARVEIVRGDVCREQDVARMLQRIASSPAPLRGIIHAAGTLDDGVLQQQEWSRFDSVLAPKVVGAWNLHRLTRESPLDFFVLFSSVASVLGSAGQGNYAAANAFLDVLAHHRRAQGLPATSVNWGPWATAGMAARLDRRSQSRWTARGVEQIVPAQGLAALEQVLRRGSTQMMVLPVRWQRFLEQYPAGMEPPLLTALAGGSQPSTVAGDGRGEDRRRQIEQAPPRKRRRLLLRYVGEQAARVLDLESSQELDSGRPLKELGFDSLLAVELRNALESSLGRTLPATLMFDYPSIQAMVGYLADEVFADEPQPPEARPPEERDVRVEELVGLPEVEVEKMLIEELEKMSP